MAIVRMILTRTPPVVHDEYCESAEHIATAVDYDKVLVVAVQKGTKLCVVKLHSLWRALKLRDIHLLHQRLLMNNHPY